MHAGTLLHSMFGMQVCAYSCSGTTVDRADVTYVEIHCKSTYHLP